MVKNILSVAVASAILVGSAYSSAESYVGISFGSADYETNSNLDAVAADVGVNSISTDEKDSGFQIYYGHKVTPSLALELSYTDFGEIVSNGPGTLSGLAIDLDIKQELSAFGVAAVYQFNQDGVFKPYVKAGLNRIELDAEVSITSGTSSASSSGSTSGTDFSYGLGFDVSVSDALGIRAGYEVFNIDAETIDDISMLSIGLNYQF